MYTELTAGYHVDPERLINGAVFDVDYSEMVVVRDIPFYSLCEHHLLPFFGTASVAYIPRGRVVGLSKIPRIVEMYSRRLQVQERLTQQIAQFLQDRLDPQGVGVVMEATHLCAAMRGVRKPGTIMTTSAVLGLFRTRDRTRAEFFAHLERRPPERLTGRRTAQPPAVSRMTIRPAPPASSIEKRSAERAASDRLEHRPASDATELLPIEGDAAGATIDAQLDADAGRTFDVEVARRRHRGGSARRPTGRPRVRRKESAPPCIREGAQVHVGQVAVRSCSIRRSPRHPMGSSR